MTGKLHRAFEFEGGGHFSYRQYLRRNGIYWVLSVKKDASVEVIKKNQGNPLKAAALKLRGRGMEILRCYLHGYEVDILQAFLLGGRLQIPEEIRNLFVVTGTAHILAISGMNMSAVAFVVFFFLRTLHLPRRTQLVGTILFIIAYAFVTGAQESIVRAAVMIVIVFLGRLVEREGETLNSLALAALIILTADPYGIFDIGFQLSFMGVFSIICFYPPLYDGLKRLMMKKSADAELPRWVVMLTQAFCVSLAAKAVCSAESSFVSG